MTDDEKVKLGRAMERADILAWMERVADEPPTLHDDDPYEVIALGVEAGLHVGAAGRVRT